MKFFLLFVFSLIKIVNCDRYYEFIPELIGSLNSNNFIEFESNCFKKVNITLDIKNDNYIINYQNYKMKHIVCMDVYFSGSINSQNINFIPSIKHEYSILIKFKNKKIDISDINFNGYHIFYFKNGVVNSISSFINTIQLFVGNNLEENNILFLKEKMNYDIKLNQESEVEFNHNKIKTGDILLLNRLDGLDQLIMWGTGSYIGHTAIAVWIKDELYVLESTDANPYGKICWDPPYGIIKNKWSKWYKMVKNCSSFVSILRLNSNLNLDFNKGIEFFKSVEGLPYGYNNFIFGWIDTLYDNYPNPFSSEFLYVLLNKFSNKKDSFPNKYFSQGLNKRLGTENLNFNEVLVEALNKKIKFKQLLIVPERDKWIYKNKIRPGRSMVCDVFVLSFLKSSGLFKNIDIDVSEFTPKDLYQLKIFNDTWLNKSNIKCLNNDSWCQILGLYYMDLNDFNSIDIYPRMNQNCGSKPPFYKRLKNC